MLNPTQKSPIYSAYFSPIIKNELTFLSWIKSPKQRYVAVSSDSSDYGIVTGEFSSILDLLKTLPSYVRVKYLYCMGVAMPKEEVSYFEDKEFLDEHRTTIEQELEKQS